MMESEWVKLSADGKSIKERAPKCYTVDGVVVPATDELHREHGFHPFDVSPPVHVFDGYHWERRDGYAIGDDGCVRQNFEAVPDAPRVRTFSKLKLWAALSQSGKWSAFKAWLDVTGYAEAWNLAQNLATDYDGWEEIVAAAQSALGMTDEELSAILDAAEVVV